VTIKKKIEEVIDKGAGVKEDEDSRLEFVTISLRIPKDMLKQLDNHVKNNRVGISRNGFILEAIDKKIIVDLM
jgi:hypothetical protein